MNKIIRLGHGADGDVFCRIRWDGGKLSITGVEGPKRNGNCVGACGQIAMHLRARDIPYPAPGWDHAKIACFLETWDRWHLNTMRAGSQVQEDWLRANPIPREESAYPNNYYTVACAKLKAAGLNPDPSGYEYGSSWKHEEVPPAVIEWLEGLPDTDKVPAWV